MRKLSGMLVLSLALCIPVMAGHVQNPAVPEPPPEDPITCQDCSATSDPESSELLDGSVVFGDSLIANFLFNTLLILF